MTLPDNFYYMSHFYYKSDLFTVLSPNWFPWVFSLKTADLIVNSFQMRSVILIFIHFNSFSCVSNLKKKSTTVQIQSIAQFWHIALLALRTFQLLIHQEFLIFLVNLNQISDWLIHFVINSDLHNRSTSFDRSSRMAYDDVG